MTRVLRAGLWAVSAFVILGRAVSAGFNVKKVHGEVEALAYPVDRANFAAMLKH